MNSKRREDKRNKSSFHVQTFPWRIQNQTDW